MSWYPNADEAMRRVRVAMQQGQGRLTPHQQRLQRKQLLQQQRIQSEAQAMHLGSQIRSKRVSMRLNEQQLADFCDIPPDKIIALERGCGQRVSLDETLRIMQALGLQFSTFPQW